MYVQVCGGVSVCVCDCMYCGCTHMQQMRCNARNSTMSAQASMNSMIRLVGNQRYEHAS